MTELANMFDTSSDQEEQSGKTKEGSTSPTSHRSITPTPATRDHRKSNRSERSSPRTDASQTPVKTIKSKKNRLAAFMANLDGSDNEPDPTPRIESRPGSSPNVVHDFLATLQQSDDEEEAENSSNTQPLAKMSSVGMFDDEEEERERAVRAGKNKIKVSYRVLWWRRANVQGLKKAELEEMRRDIARNQRSMWYTLLSVMTLTLRQTIRAI
jgi:hypothetical protein